MSLYIQHKVNIYVMFNSHCGVLIPEKYLEGSKNMFENHNNFSFSVKMTFKKIKLQLADIYIRSENIF